MEETINPINPLASEDFCKTSLDVFRDKLDTASDEIGLFIDKHEDASLGNVVNETIDAAGAFVEVQIACPDTDILN